jgi:hypothetical protein
MGVAGKQPEVFGTDPKINEPSLACDILLFVATSTEVDELQAAAEDLNLSFAKRKGEESHLF